MTGLARFDNIGSVKEGAGEAVVIKMTKLIASSDFIAYAVAGEETGGRM